MPIQMQSFLTSPLISLACVGSSIVHIEAERLEWFESELGIDKLIKMTAET